MTVIAHGERLDAVAGLREKYPDAEFVYFSEKPEADESPAYEMSLRWKTLTLPRAHLVFVDPPKELKPKELKPGSHRHVLFTGKIPAAWLTWGRSPGVETLGFHIDADQLVALLTAGSPEAGVPKFTRAAAEQLVSANPGGMHALGTAIDLVTAAELPQPIQLNDVLALWPYAAATSKKVYTVDLGDLIPAIGTQKAVVLAASVKESEAVAALHTLRGIYFSKVGSAKLAKKDCMTHQKKVKFADVALHGMYDKFWTGKAALVLFTLACFEDSTCPSPMKTASSSSLRTPVLWRLLGIRP